MSQEQTVRIAQQLLAEIGSGARARSNSMHCSVPTFCLRSRATLAHYLGSDEGPGAAPSPTLFAARAFF